MLTDKILGTILMLSFCSFFICVFFFTYGRSIEKQTVAEQAKLLARYVKGNADIASIFMNQKMLQIYRDRLKAYLRNNGSPSKNQRIEIANDLIRRRAFALHGKIFGSGLAAFVLICIVARYSFSRAMAVLMKNLMIFGVMVIAEIGFLLLVSKNTVMIDPNHVVRLFLNRLVYERRKFIAEGRPLIDSVDAEGRRLIASAVDSLISNVPPNLTESNVWDIASNIDASNPFT